MNVYVKKKMAICLCCALLFIAVSSASATDYYVATNGNDQASGRSTSFPWRTLHYAANIARGGDTIFMRGGTYREWIRCTNTSASAGSHIMIEAYSNEIPVIKGSDIVTGWVTHSGDIWKREAWTNNSQQVFADGQSLTQIGWPNDYIATNAFDCETYMYIPYGYNCNDIDPVLHTIDLGDAITNMVENSFYYDAAVTTLYVWLQGAASPVAAEMEASTRVCTFQAETDSRFFDLKGLTFKHSTSVTYTEAGWASVVLGNDSTIEDCTVEWCDASGLRIRNNGQAIRCRIGNNGNGGIAPFTCTNVLISECRVYSNNYRDFNLFWASALKLQKHASGIIQSNEVYGNATHGIWLDTCRDDEEIIVRNNIVHHNKPNPNRPGDSTAHHIIGIFVEATHQALVYGNLVSNNVATGIGLSAAEDCQIANNTIVATQSATGPSNGLYGIWLMDQPLIYSVSSNHVYNNLIYNNHTHYDASLPAPNGSNVFVNYMYNNCYHRDGTNISLQYGSAAYTTLAAWAAASGQGLNSISSDPKTLFNRLEHGSPCINAGTNMPWMTTETDLDGHPRILYTTVDMGAYEYFDFGITSCTYAAASEGILFSSPALIDQHYIWQSTEDLVAGIWTNISTVITAATPSISMTDTNHEAPWRHFRSVELH